MQNNVTGAHILRVIAGSGVLEIYDKKLLVLVPENKVYGFGGSTFFYFLFLFLWLNKLH